MHPHSVKSSFLTAQSYISNSNRNITKSNRSQTNQIQFEIYSDCYLPSVRARCLEIHPPIGLSNSSAIAYQNLLKLTPIFKQTKHL
jgi:hypothetical protein